MCRNQFIHTSQITFPFFLFRVIVGSTVRVYDSEETYHSHPENFVYQLHLTPRHVPSMIYSKNYSKEQHTEIIVHYCYILLDNGLWGPSKVLKVGNSSRVPIDTFVFALRRAIKGSSSS